MCSYLVIQLSSQSSLEMKGKMIAFPLALSFFIASFVDVESSADDTSHDNLHGQHLMFIPTQLGYLMETTMNSTGHVIATRGVIPLMVDWLALRYNFTYSYVPSTANLLVDDKANQRGKLSYLKSGEADVVLSVILLSPERNKNAYFPFPWGYYPFSIVIPYPRVSANINYTGVLDPWDSTVWILLLVSVPIIIMTLYGIEFCLKKMEPLVGVRLNNAVSYVLNTLFSQGSRIYRDRFAMKCAAGAWCLACFVLIESYNCRLTSVFTLPIEKKSIVDSVYDIPKVPGLKIMVTRGMGAEAAILESTNGTFKQLGDMLRNDPNLRCKSNSECLERVLSENSVYIQTLTIVDTALRADYKEHGVCRYSVAKETFWPSPYGFAMAKDSRYKEQFNRGIIELMEYGLLDLLVRQYNPEKNLFCFKKRKNEEKKIQSSSSKYRLSLKNLASAFIVLIIGYSISFVVFIGEVIIYRLRTRRIVVV